MYFSVECGGRKPEEPAVKIDVCRNVEGAMECIVDWQDVFGCVWMGSKASGAIGDKLSVVSQVISGVGQHTGFMV